MNDIKEITWVQSALGPWLASCSQGRAPHALMLTGARGTGKRNTATFIARQHLGMAEGQALPVHPLTVPEHPDMHWVTTPADKHTIGIDSVRSLVSELLLTSYEGGGKAAVIEPADSMTTNAANSLLKTLEEPPGDTLLILVVDRAGRLPATITSRCQQLHVRTPSFDEGLAWLHGMHGGDALPGLLREAGGAPLAALAAIERLDDTRTMETEFRAIAEGSAAPLPVAARWSRYEPQFVLGWLGRQVQQCISATCAGVSGAGPGTPSQSVLGCIDTRNMFCYLDIINKLRSQPPGSYNVQLTLETLLIDWSQGLATIKDSESYP